ncbi:MAG: cyclase family protein [Clostridia bacterium]|nr:cyclase family protein [Clostridia bacterium]
MIYDISQPVFGCTVYPTHPAPERKQLRSIAAGDPVNVTAFSMCAHNGTHVDAPRHFLADGVGLNGIPLEKFAGDCYVCFHDGAVGAADAAAMLESARMAKPGAEKKILIGGKALVTLAAAEVFAAAGVDLVGNESQSVGPEDAPMAVHKLLLGAGVVLLEGVRLAHVPAGVYLLHAVPLDLGDADGAPCRATLMG